MQAFKLYGKKELQNSSLIVAWSEDVANLGTNVVDYLNKKLGTEELGEIEPMNFFPLGGVSVENDIAQGMPVMKIGRGSGTHDAYLKR